MRYRDLVAGTFAVSLLLCQATFTFAQDRGPTIPNDIISSPTPLTNAQQEVVTTYIDYYVNQLINSKRDAEVTAARDLLIAPLRQGGSQNFTTFYDRTAAGRLGDGLQKDKRPLIRINVMLVARNLKDARIIDVIKKGLLDESSGVVYWAAEAARRITESDDVGPNIKQQLEAPLMEALKDERSTYVVDVLYQALIPLRTIKAWTAVVDKMNARVKQRADEKNPSFDAEVNGVRLLVRHMVLAGNDVNVPQGLHKEFTRAAVRTMVQATELKLNTNDVESRAHYAQAIAVIDQNLHGYLVKQIEGFDKVPQPLRGEDDATQRLRADDWIRRLKQNPFMFTDEQLKAEVRKPEPEPEPEPEPQPEPQPDSTGNTDQPGDTAGTNNQPGL